MLLLRLACRHSGGLLSNAFVVRTRMPALPGRLLTSNTGRCMSAESSGSRMNSTATEKTPEEKEIIQAEREARK